MLRVMTSDTSGSARNGGFLCPGSHSRISSENAQLQQQKKSLSALYCNLLSYWSERQNQGNPAPIGATSVSDPAPVLCHSALIPLIPTVVNGVAVDSVPLSYYSNTCHCSGIVYIYDVIAHMLLSSVKKKFFDFLLFQAQNQKAELYCRAPLAIEAEHLTTTPATQRAHELLAVALPLALDQSTSSHSKGR